MRALLCSTSGAGHLGPLLPFARALRARGARVTFVVPPALAASLAEWEAVVVADDPPAEATAALWARVAAEPGEAARLVNGELFGALSTAAMLPAVERACDELAPTLVLHDPCAYAAPIAAARRGVACAQVAISLARVEEGSLAHAAPALERIEPGIVARLHAQPYLSRFPAALDPSPFADTRRYREHDDPHAALRGEVTAAPLGPAPLGPAPLGPAALGTTSPGAVQRRVLPDWWPGDARALVYATLGSVAAGRAGAAEAYRALAAAVARLDARVLLTVGREQDPAMLGSLPPHVRVESWIAQERVLPHAAAVLCHGGSGTLFGALAAGVPVVALPLFADQPINAELLAASGAGIALTPPFEATAIERAVGAVLAERSYGRAARRVAAELAAAPTAADVLRVGLDPHAT